MTISPSVASLLSAALLACTGLASTPAVLAQPVSAPAPLVTGLPDFSNLIDRVAPAVVNIRTTEKVKPGQGGSGDAEMQEFLRRFFGMPIPRGRGGQPGEEIQRGVGSGFIVSPDGSVLTNAHVVEGADEVTVTLTDRRELKARVIGADKRSDVALLKVEGARLPYLVVGDSSKIRVGEWVIAIGSPFNLDSTVTAGIISAKARDTGEYLPLIQSDVAVNPGNSGGPLINMRGEVIGINSQIATLSGGYNGISFAVPIDEVMRVADQLKKTGKVTRGRIGVQIAEVSKEVAESLGLGRARGVEVSLVDPGGPAERAGVRVGDIILAYNGQPLERSADLPRLVGASQIGSRATLTIWRQGRQQDVAVNIAQLEDEDEEREAAKPAPNKPAPEQAANALGLRVADVSEAQRKALRIQGGVLVVAADGAAAAAGLRHGDLVLQINNAEVKDARQFNAMVARLDAKKSVALLVRRENTTRYVVIKPRR